MLPKMNKPFKTTHVQKLFIIVGGSPIYLLYSSHKYT